MQEILNVNENNINTHFSKLCLPENFTIFNVLQATNLELRKSLEKFSAWSRNNSTCCKLRMLYFCGWWLQRLSTDYRPCEWLKISQACFEHTNDVYVDLLPLVRHRSRKQNSSQCNGLPKVKWRPRRRKQFHEMERWWWLFSGIPIMLIRLF